MGTLRATRPVARPVRGGAAAGHGRAFWLLTCAFGVVMLGTTAPSPLYPAYEERFGLGGLSVTVVYAVFAAGVLTALLVFGQAGDVIGRKRVLLLGLGLAGISSALFLTAGALHDDGFTLLLAGRVLSGLSAGIFTGTASAALADLAGPRCASRAALIAALANLGGTGFGPLLAGSIAQWAPTPLQTVFVVHLALLAVAATAVVAIPETVPIARRSGFSPQRPRIPRPARSAFIPAAAAAFAGFAVSGLFVAVSPALLAALGYREPAYTGAIVSVMFAAGAAGTIASRRMRTHRALTAGTALLLGGLAVLAIALAERSSGWLTVAATIAGASQGIGLRAALASVTAATPATQRGLVTSAFFAVAYVGGISIPVLGLAIARRPFGLITAGEAFAAIVGALTLVALVHVARTPRRQNGSEAPRHADARRAMRVA